jgi:hypothetical protein
VGGESTRRLPIDRMSPHQHAESTAAYVDSLLICVDQLTVILDHMARHENPDADAPIDETLARLLAEVLGDEAELRASDLETAGAVLTATSDAIEDGIFLVDSPPTPPPPLERSSRNGNNRRGRRSEH